MRMLLIEYLSLLPGIVTAAQIIVLAARAAVRSAQRKGRRQVTVARCAVDGRPVPSVVSREFSQWANAPGIGFICPQCQRLLPP